MSMISKDDYLELVDQFTYVQMRDTRADFISFAAKFVYGNLYENSTKIEQERLIAQVAKDLENVR